MTTLSAFAFPCMDTFCQAQFTNIDALHRAQGEALGLLSFGPNECDYHVIMSGPHWRLRKYASDDAQSSLLIVPAPIKRPYIWDLAPSISTIRHCLDHHFGVYLLEWKPPLTNGKQPGLVDYADRAISECVAQVSHESQGSRPILMGHSLGGTLAAIFCALEQESVRGLVLLGAPLCFAPGSSQFRDGLVSLFPRMLDEAEIVPGSLLSQVSALASPDAFVWARLRDAVHSVADPATMNVHVRVERWALDEVPLPGPLLSEILQLLYRENRFCRGTLTMRDRSLGPSDVRVPILAIVNTADEVAPLNSVKQFLDEMPPKKTRIIEYAGEAGVGLQHLGMLVGPQARVRIWPEIFSWLKSQN
jgi:polyhydroxyalkanoate synthase subunit PhaC